MGDSPDNIVWGRFDDAQREITRWADEQFPGRTDHQTLFKLVMHEVPELLVHKKENGVEGIGTELADCFILLLDLASMWDVNIVEAIRAKMEINYRRIWERDTHGIMQHVKMAPQRPDIPRRIDHQNCPSCGKTHNIFSTPPNSKWAYICYDCGNEFNDDIPF